ncbi:hypothetical protein CS378_08360 [Rhodococcus ruber]|uniref:hypothetical protein n=1 Tax=Rhodococcus TaxID=1827 RepID=UPI000299E88B|nr:MULTISPECIES: hypothetical protein [Rhodococcus]ATQ28736.1 hypothetical protein CS378_08360 [Rhodococcus ruber]QGS70784.1 hypothetical protein E2561_17010 [Rhodococcus ruber]
MPPQRRKPNPAGPPRGRRPKIAGTGRTGGAVRPEATGPTPSGPTPPESPSPESTPLEPTPPESPPAPTAGAGTAAAEATGSSAAPAGPGSGSDRTSAPEPHEPAPVDDGGDAEEPAAQAVGTASRGSWRAVAIVGGAALALGAFAAVAAARPGATVSNEAWVDSTATSEVTAAAGNAIETMHGYNYETIDEDFAEIREVLTPPMREEFDLTAEVTKQAAVQTHTATEVRIDHIGASMLDDDRAEVAAFISVSATGDAVAQGSASAPLLVRMEKIDGKWLVSEIRDS